jgi:hypothetical protein
VQPSSIGTPQRGSRQVFYLAEPRDKNRCVTCYSCAIFYSLDNCSKFNTHFCEEQLSEEVTSLSLVITLWFDFTNISSTKFVLFSVDFYRITYSPPIGALTSDCRASHTHLQCSLGVLSSAPYLVHTGLVSVHTILKLL